MLENEKPILILGTGGHSKVIANALLLLQKDIIGFLTSEINPPDSIMGIEVLGDDTALNNYDPNMVNLVNGIGSISNKGARLDMAQKMKKKGYKFEKVIHPGAILSNDVEISDGVQIMAGCVIQPGVKIGENTIINTSVSVDHDSIIGSNCHIAPGVTCSGGVSISDNVHIGTGSSIIQNIFIGKNTIIAAGSVIFHDIKPDSLVIQKRYK